MLMFEKPLGGPVRESRAVQKQGRAASAYQWIPEEVTVISAGTSATAISDTKLAVLQRP